MNKLKVEGNHNTNNILTGRDYVYIEINSSIYKPCPVCQRSWIEKAEKICNNCKVKPDEYKKINLRKRIFYYMRFGLLAWIFLALIISGIAFYNVYDESDILFTKISKFNDVCFYSFIISAFIISFLYIVFIIYKKIKSRK